MSTNGHHGVGKSDFMVTGSFATMLSRILITLPLLMEDELLEISTVIAVGLFSDWSVCFFFGYY